ncbi:uncharacterized protein TEOVI_000258300 [Trypanosoma equiperdum]|uniref:Uncharacterized protein n=1 Tax=Trypanosoma equiperdum TaxID=5694 RepID=A0A1G4IFT9_TRYEQ|nr:hypothetical protein, conserved [Trypanosoma equiperdum]
MISRKDTGNSNCPRSGRTIIRSAVMSLPATPAPLLDGNGHTSTVGPTSIKTIATRRRVMYNSPSYAAGDNSGRVKTLYSAHELSAVSLSNGNWKVASGEPPSGWPPLQPDWSIATHSIPSQRTARNKNVERTVSLDPQEQLLKEGGSGTCTDGDVCPPSARLVRQRHAETREKMPAGSTCSIIAQLPLREQNPRSGEERQPQKLVGDGAVGVDGVVQQSTTSEKRKRKKVKCGRKRKSDSEPLATDRSYVTVLEGSQASLFKNGMCACTPSISNGSARNSNFNDEGCAMNSFSSSVQRSASGPVVTEKWARSIIQPQDEYLLYDRRTPGAIKQEDLVRRGQVILLRERIRCGWPNCCSAHRNQLSREKLADVRTQRHSCESTNAVPSDCSTLDVGDRDDTASSRIVQMNERRIIERGTPLLFRRPYRRLFSDDEKVSKRSDICIPANSSSAPSLGIGSDIPKGHGRSDTSIMVSSIYNLNFSNVSRPFGSTSSTVVTDIAASSNDKNKDCNMPSASSGAGSPGKEKIIFSGSCASQPNAQNLSKAKCQGTTSTHSIAQLLDDAVTQNLDNLVGDPFFLFCGDENHERLLLMQEEHEARVSLKRRCSKPPGCSSSSSSTGEKGIEGSAFQSSPRKESTFVGLFPKQLDMGSRSATENEIRAEGAVAAVGNQNGVSSLSNASSGSLTQSWLIGDDEDEKKQGNLSPRSVSISTGNVDERTSEKLQVKGSTIRSTGTADRARGSEKSVHLTSALARRLNNNADDAACFAEKTRLVVRQKSDSGREGKKREEQTNLVTPLDFSVLHDSCRRSPSQAPETNVYAAPQRREKRPPPPAKGHSKSDFTKIQSVPLSSQHAMALSRASSTSPPQVAGEPLRESLNLSDTEIKNGSVYLNNEIEEFLHFVHRQEQEKKRQKETRSANGKRSPLKAINSVVGTRQSDAKRNGSNGKGKLPLPRSDSSEVGEEQVEADDNSPMEEEAHYAQSVVSVLSSFGQMWNTSFHDVREHRKLPLHVRAQLLLFDVVAS